MILLTGASGFVGKALLHHFHAQRTPVRAVFRSQGSIPQQVQALQGVQPVVAQLDAAQDWTAHAQGVHTVIHCAARVHVMHDDAQDPLQAYRAVNVQGTLQLAQACAAQGVQRFIFLSSVKVMGERTAPGQPFTLTDTPCPSDPYGVSKWEAEQALLQLAQHTGMQVVVLRLPLVYGPGVRANFLAMARAVQRGWPLPLGAVRDNRRSLVSLANVVDLLQTVVNYSGNPTGTYFVSDGEDVSTHMLLSNMAQALGRTPRLWNVPPRFLQWAARMLGREAVVRRLTESLQVDMRHTQHVFAWTPPQTLQQGLQVFARSMCETLV